MGQNQHFDLNTNNILLIKALSREHM